MVQQCKSLLSRLFEKKRGACAERVQAMDNYRIVFSEEQDGALHIMQDIVCHRPEQDITYLAATGFAPDNQ